MIAYLDTHTAVWLASNRVQKLSSAARRAIDSFDLLISPMALLELQYLYEIGRTTAPADAAYSVLHRVLAVTVCTYPFADIVLGSAVYERWTRDPFDRVIVAHARANGRAPLISADVRVQEAYDNTVW